ncbi:LysM peptidoglycan-binding domain-containing protein [Acetohalobium arabaticum]|uniref:Peptidoglycan-binding lysin domain protein n=1 Tax=Acetohalobium arabaticum (strain ATCC 49924 / DSM 5501 / Z-7288) TaxID=574087 RepID=D9QRC9_ACEAZ|nr:LysM peptidoglycan-binding domain-containing protein [Acetohalobium arabaticum]ADL13070.1 Peptidoglycan-binding lysin domain protein [Acetohalobium arabaticum DSM 5501]
MNGISLSRVVRSRERLLQQNYRQLDQQVTDSDPEQIIRQLRRIQNQQLNLLDDLISGLEEPTPPSPSVKLAQHIVQQGETLFLLARKYNTTVARILRVNPDIEDPDVIQTGMVINLPIILPQRPECYFEYTVKPGDTLFRLAQRFDTTVNQLVYYNSISDSDLIYPGRILLIPCPDNQDNQKKSLEEYEGDIEVANESNNENGIYFDTLARDNENNFNGTVKDNLFTADTKFRLERILENFGIQAPERIDFEENIVIGAVGYDIEALDLEDRTLKVVVTDKPKGYHLIKVTKEEFSVEGSHRIDFVTAEDSSLDQKRINISF